MQPQQSHGQLVYFANTISFNMQLFKHLTSYFSHVTGAVVRVLICIESTKAIVLFLLAPLAILRMTGIHLMGVPLDKPMDG